MTLKHLLCIGVAAAAVAMASQAGASTVIYSENFSSPDLNGGWHNVSSYNGWTSLIGDGVEIGGSGNYGLACVSVGCQNLEINGTTYGSDMVTIGGLTPGQSYTLSYDYGVRNSNGPSSATVTFGGQVVSVDGVTGGDYWATGWYHQSFTVTATGTSADLVITGAATGTPSYGNEYTNFSLSSAVPEPSTWAMMGLGFAALGFAGFRSRRTPISALA